MAQVFGVLGLLPALAGAWWLGYEIRRRERGKRGLPTKARGRPFALASLITSSIVAIAASVVAFATVGVSGLLVAVLSWF